MVFTLTGNQVIRLLDRSPKLEQVALAGRSLDPESRVSSWRVAHRYCAGLLMQDHWPGGLKNSIFKTSGRIVELESGSMVRSRLQHIRFNVSSCSHGYCQSFSDPSKSHDWQVYSDSIIGTPSIAGTIPSQNSLEVRAYSSANFPNLFPVTSFEENQKVETSVQTPGFRQVVRIEEIWSYIG